MTKRASGSFSVYSLSTFYLDIIIQCDLTSFEVCKRYGLILTQKTAATAARVELLQQTTGSIVDTLAWILTCALEEGVVGALVQYLAQTGAFFMAEVKIINHTNHDELKNYYCYRYSILFHFILRL